jgi:uncharacterized protein (DUF1501 family)
MLDPDISTLDAARHLHTPEPTDRATLDRRRFLQMVGMGLGAGLVAGGTGSLLDELLLGHDPSTWASAPVGGNDGILVVMCLFGGNDGLNTVVPINDGHYYAQHGALAVGGGQTLQLNGSTGLHPALTAVKSRWDRGEVAIVEGIGYPNPNLSHFTSMAYWMGAQPSGIPTSGWLGRWLDGLLGGSKNIYAAAEVGQSLPLHLRGAVQRGTVVPVNRPEFGASYEPVDQQMYLALRNAYTTAQGPWHAAVAEATADFLDLSAAITPAYPAAMPASEPVAKAEAAARLINANLGLRVITLSWADFDSHALQPNMHPVRMQELNSAIARFFEVLDPAWSSRVTLMTFSEFGRTSWANAGAGTDHGTAAPHLVIGQNVRGGFHGQRPSIAGLGRWDRMPHHVDFRSYYASIIDGWLGGGSGQVLGGSYEDLRLFARPPGLNADGTMSPGPAVVTPPSYLSPVSPFRLVDTRDGTGGALDRVMGPGERIRVQVAGVGPIPAAGVTAVVANVTSVAATDPNFFTVYPGSTMRPSTSNLNSGPGRTVPNLVVMGVGADGCIEVFNSHGYAHCLVDVFAFCTEQPGDRFTAVRPARLFDTRTGQGVRPGKVPGGELVDVQVAGYHGIPGAGATAVVMNLTVTEPESPGFMRATPTGQTSATTSNLNFDAGQTVPNLVICKLGDGGRVTIDGLGPGAHVIGDVFGYFGAGGDRLRALPPRRLLDTRDGVGAPTAPVSSSIRVPIAGRGQVPFDATAVVLNVTATNVSGPSFVTVWPEGEPQPDTSNLNVAGGQTIANLVICRLGAGGALRFASPVAPCDLIADVLGFFAA